MKKLMVSAFAVAVVLTFSSLAFAANYGYGSGCSALGGVAAGDLVNGDYFTGVLGAPAIYSEDVNENGLADSIEVCINDSLLGYCEFESGDVTISNVTCDNYNKRGKCLQLRFRATINDVSTCLTPTE